MDKKSEEGRKNGGENDTNDTKEGETTQVTDEVAEIRDTENGVAPNVSDVIETDACQGPGAVSGAKTTSEKPSDTVPSGSGSPQLKAGPELQENRSGGDTKAAVSGAKTTSEKPSDTVPSGSGSPLLTAGPVLQENRSGVDTKTEVMELNDEAQNATKVNNISHGKTDQTKASNSEEQPDPGPSQGTDQVETSRMVQYQDGVSPQTAADSPTELEGNKAIKEPSNKPPEAPSAQSDGTQEPLPGSGAEEQEGVVQASNGESVTSLPESVEATTTGTLKYNPKSSPSVVPGAGLDTHTGSAPGGGPGQTDEEESGEPQIPDSSSEPKEIKPETVPRNPTTNPPTPDSGSKDPKEGARERQTNEKSEEEKRATENKANEQKVSKEVAAATKDGTKKDGTTKQRVNEEKVEDVSKERPVSISVCTSAYDFNVQGFVSFLKDHKKDHPELIKEVKVHALPYNDLDHYKFPEENPVDVMLLCHSINNRRFAITDVMDALYDEYLPYCQSVIGKNKMGVIVHDFDDMRETVQSSRMGSFRYKQPKAFETTSLQITCGHIEKKEQVFKQMQKADQEKVLEFLKNASTFPEEMMEEMNADPSLYKVAKKGIVKYGKKASSYCKSMVGWSQDSTSEGSSVVSSEAERNDHGTFRNAEAQHGKTKRLANERQPSYQQTKRLCLTKKGTSSGAHRTPQASVDERNPNPSRDVSPGTYNEAAAAHTQCSPGQLQSMASGRNVTSAPQSSSPRRISISVCSSAYEHNVKGFKSKLTELQAGQLLMTDVHFRSLPYNDIDSFRFPSNDPVDVMVLCHSVQNRGFSITNVMNALYEKYLQYCHGVIGKKKLAVIVHDFSDCKPKTLDVRMESFMRSQPLTFELVDTVIVCGSLEVPGKIEMRDEDVTRLTHFFERAGFEPKENNADDQSLWKRFLGKF